MSDPYGDALTARARALARLRHLDSPAARAWELTHVGDGSNGTETAEQIVALVRAQADELEALVATATARRTN